MDCIGKRSVLKGHISVPGSKSHTIRACLFAALADGVSYIRNPLPSADCLSAARCIAEIGASVRMEADHSVWTVVGAGARAHLPANVVDVGNSGSVLYFLTPIAATFSGWSVFTGDESIRTRPVNHLADALRQLGAETHVTRPGTDAPPLLVKGPIGPGTVVTDGRLSQYVSGLMMAAARMNGTTDIELTDPKEVPYLAMTKQWLESVGIPVGMNADFTRISVSGPHLFPAIDRTIPSDWEAVAFPLVAALLTDSSIVIDNIDGSGSQGDEAIVAVLQSVGADITWDRAASRLVVNGGTESQKGIGFPGRLSTERLSGGILRVNCAGFPDAVPALCAAACFIEGTTIIEDIAVCRKKETDRIAVMKAELSKLGACVEDGPDFIVIHGHSPLSADGTRSAAFSLHGGAVDSYADHRVAMSFAVLSLALAEPVTVTGCECCAVSFPDFFQAMGSLGADFVLK